MDMRPLFIPPLSGVHTPELAQISRRVRASALEVGAVPPVAQLPEQFSDADSMVQTIAFVRYYSGALLPRTKACGWRTTSPYTRPNRSLAAFSAQSQVDS